MRFTTTFSVLLLALHAEAVTHPGEDADAAITPFVELGDVSPASPLLENRACNYNGCRCNSRGRSLTVCGNCLWTDTGKYIVTRKRQNNHIFECAPNGNCCDYGRANDCGGSNARCRVN